MGAAHTTFLLGGEWAQPCAAARVPRLSGNSWRAPSDAMTECQSMNLHLRGSVHLGVAYPLGAPFACHAPGPLHGTGHRGPSAERPRAWSGPARDRARDPAGVPPRCRCRWLRAVGLRRAPCRQSALLEAAAAHAYHLGLHVVRGAGAEFEVEVSSFKHDVRRTSGGPWLFNAHEHMIG